MRLLARWQTIATTTRQASLARVPRAAAVLAPLDSLALLARPAPPIMRTIPRAPPWPAPLRQTATIMPAQCPELLLEGAHALALLNTAALLAMHARPTTKTMVPAVRLPAQ